MRAATADTAGACPFNRKQLRLPAKEIPMPLTFAFSDPHFGHPLLARKRGFDSPKDMSQSLLDNIADTLRGLKGFRVLCLGDLSLGSPQHTQFVVKSLRAMGGAWALVPGNHDSNTTRKIIRDEKGWEELPPIYEWKITNSEWEVPTRRLVFCHYPMDAWRGSGPHRPMKDQSWHLHGHRHHADFTPKINRVNVCWDVVQRLVCLDTELPKLVAESRERAEVLAKSDEVLA